MVGNLLAHVRGDILPQSGEVVTDPRRCWVSFEAPVTLFLLDLPGFMLLVLFAFLHAPAALFGFLFPAC